MIQFWREHPDAIMPLQSREGDVGYDLYSVDAVKIPSHCRVLIPIGLRIVCPPHIWYTFAPRSGHAFKHNIIPSHLNVMDSNYTGDCSVLMWNRSDVDYQIAKGERFCQLIIWQKPSIMIKEISREQFQQLVDQSQRGDCGFGSSGK